MTADDSRRRILVVCTANVCRSFMASAMLRHRAERLGLGIVVTSAGTRMPGLPVDPDAVRVLEEMGVDVPDHVPRQLERAIVRSEGSDLIVTMTREHLREVVAVDRSAWPRTFTLRELVRRVSALDTIPAEWEDRLALLAGDRLARDLMTPDPGDDIPDPYGLSLAAHRECASTIGTLVGVLLSSGLLRLP